MKDFLYWNNSQNKLRIAQGIPQSVPVYPKGISTIEEISKILSDTIFHVSNQSGQKDSVHIFVSSPVECTIYVKVQSASTLLENGTKTMLKSWPSTIDAMTFKIRSNQPSPIPVMQGFTVSNGAGISLMASASGAKAFGFITRK